MPYTVAIIDIGSNSIKLLVANKLGYLKEDFRGSRIGQGISETNFIIKEDVIQRNITAIVELLNEAKPYHPDLTIITGTSAVRDALNREEFCERVKKTTGISVKILTGEEEARTIAQGVATDPNLKAYKEFCHFDIGGGSLECIHYKNGDLLLTNSLPLGIVRLTEKYIPDPIGPISIHEIKTIMDVVGQAVHNFPTKTVPLIGSGGGFSEAINILNKGPTLQLTDLEDLLNKLASISMQERISQYKILPFRADVMPTALAIIITLAKKAEAKEITYSHFSLRFGLAAQALKDSYTNSHHTELFF